MKRLDNRFLLGGLLVLGGVIFLLQNLGVLILNNLIWGIVLAIAGLSFIYVTISDRRSWWAIIPGIILLYTGLLVFLDYFAPESVGRIGGELFLGAIGLSFLVVYLLNRSNWWAIIPAGVLFTLSATAVASNYFAGMQTGGLFFLGLAITFAVLALVPTSEGRMRWPLIPAGILGLMGILITAASANLLNIIWPVALILLGVWFFIGRRG